LWPDPELQAFVTQLEKGLADQQARKAQARQLRDQAQALQQQGRIAEAIAGYRQSLGLWPDPELEDFVRKLEAGMAQTKPLPVPAPATQAPVPAAVVPTVNPVGVWRHEPSASWTIRACRTGSTLPRKPVWATQAGPESGRLPVLSGLTM
jgi:tetratricopeptide (TPR) repeat protein